VELSDVDRRAQAAYARWLEAATLIGFALSALAFLVYATGVLPAFVAPADLPRLWQLPVKGYLEATGAPAGWGWLALAGHGDYLCVAALALFAAVSAACYARLLPLFVRSGAWLDASLAAAQLAVLALAASGWLSA
jgi:hypothetical protein